VTSTDAAQIAAHRHGRGALSFKLVDHPLRQFRADALRGAHRSPVTQRHGARHALGPECAEDRHRRLGAHALDGDEQAVPFPLIGAEKPEKLQEILAHQKLGIKRHGLTLRRKRR
jgi:hypothetical protein